MFLTLYNNVVRTFFHCTYTTSDCIVLNTAGGMLYNYGNHWPIPVKTHLKK